MEPKAMFYLTEGEEKKARDWIKKHDKTHIPSGSYSWCFSQNGIGVACVVKCMCGDEINVTDYDLW